MRQREHATGIRYDLSARVRLDARWFAPLPSAAWDAVVGGTEKRAVVEHEFSYGGLNDRFVLASREAFEA